MSLFAIVCVCVVPVRSAADSDQPQAEVVEASKKAKLLFERARSAIDEGRFSEARDALRESLAEFPRPSTGYNLAISLRGTGEITEALKTLGTLTAGTYGAMTQAQQAQARELTEELRREVAMLRVRLIAPASASASINGGDKREIHHDTAIDVMLDPTRHRLRVSAPGHIDFESTVRLYAGDRRTIEVSLKRSAATLEVWSSNPEHEVQILGEAKGKGRVRRQLEPGAYTISVFDGSRRATRTVKLEPGAAFRAQMELPPKPLYKQVWFWAGIGLGAAAIGTGAYFLARPETRPLRTTDDFDSVVRVR